MFTDDVYRLISQIFHLPIIAAVSYTFFVILLLLTVGIINSLRNSNSKSRKDFSIIKSALKNHFRNPLSWVWPLFVVLPISLIYITSHRVVDELNLSLNLKSYLTEHYPPVLFSFISDNLQYFIWIMSIGFALRAYLIPIKANLWFNRSKILRVIMIIFSDLIIAYIALTAIINLLFASISLYLYLGDNSIIYNFWHPDFNYGIFTSQYFFTYLFFMAIAFSLLPLVMVIPPIRKAQAVCPKGMYFALTATALAVAGLLFFLLVPQYNRRIEQIKKTQLEQTIADIESRNPTNKSEMKLQTYITLKNLDNGYDVPFIFSSVIALRSMYFLMEVHQENISSVVPKPRQKSFLSLLLLEIKKMIQDLS